MKISSAFVLMTLMAFHFAQAADIRVDLINPALASNCTEEQIKDQFFQFLRPMTSMKAPATQIVGFQEGTCRIQGLIRKTKVGYEFHPNQGQAGASSAVMSFHSLAEIVQLVKATQNPGAAAATPSTPEPASNFSSPAQSSFASASIYYYSKGGSPQVETPPASVSSPSPEPMPAPKDIESFGGKNPFGSVSGAH